MNYGLGRLFTLMNRESEPCPSFCHALPDNEGQGDLFGGDGKEKLEFPGIDEADILVITGLYSPEGINFSALPSNARRLFELSVNAFGAIVHAWMSELPIQAEIIRFGQRVLAATERQAADRAATDRGDPDTRTVLDTAHKVWHEIHRLLGLLRFSTDENGMYIARCEPDHFVLPAFGPHFRERFGETSWVIIDEKRRLCLRRVAQAPFELLPHTASLSTSAADVRNRGKTEEWEKIWRHYHRTINNESRNNPRLQRQFMPERYWKYLPELQAPPEL